MASIRIMAAITNLIEASRSRGLPSIITNLIIINIRQANILYWFCSSNCNNFIFDHLTLCFHRQYYAIFHLFFVIIFHHKIWTCSDNRKFSSFSLSYPLSFHIKFNPHGRATSNQYLSASRLVLKVRNFFISPLGSEVKEIIEVEWKN